MTDPVSIAQGIGPVCVMKIKENAAMNNSGHLFGTLPDYAMSIDTNAKIIALRDKDNGPTITNFARETIQHIAETWPNLDLNEYIVIYQDTDGVWDRIHTKDGCFTSFSPIRETEYKSAVARVLAP